MKVISKHTSFEELTPTLLREFVEKIVVHESEALDRKRRGKLRRQEIEIYYSFVGIIDKITEFIKDILKGWVLSNLDTMFTEVNC